MWTRRWTPPLALWPLQGCAPAKMFWSSGRFQNGSLREAQLKARNSCWRSCVVTGLIGQSTVHPASQLLRVRNAESWRCWIVSLMSNGSWPGLTRQPCAWPAKPGTLQPSAGSLRARSASNASAASLRKWRRLFQGRSLTKRMQTPSAGAYHACSQKEWICSAFGAHKPSQWRTSSLTWWPCRWKASSACPVKRKCGNWRFGNGRASLHAGAAARSFQLPLVRHQRGSSSIVWIAPVEAPGWRINTPAATSNAKESGQRSSRRGRSGSATAPIAGRAAEGLQQLSAWPGLPVQDSWRGQPQRIAANLKGTKRLAARTRQAGSSGHMSVCVDLDDVVWLPLHGVRSMIFRRKGLIDCMRNLTSQASHAWISHEVLHRCHLASCPTTVFQHQNKNVSHAALWFHVEQTYMNIAPSPEPWLCHRGFEQALLPHVGRADMLEEESWASQDVEIKRVKADV